MNCFLPSGPMAKNFRRSSGDRPWKKEPRLSGGIAARAPPPGPRPPPRHRAVDRYDRPEECDELGKAGEAMGFRHVASGPLVRSSYHADEQHDAAVLGPSV